MSLSAGASSAAITPRENLRLAGYSSTDNLLLMPFRHRVAQGVHDDIFARCLALSDGQTLLAMVALDLLGLFRDDIEAVRREARRKVGRDIEVLVASVHNHSAPDTYGAYGGVPQSYKDLIADQASAAVATAVKEMQPARLGFASADLGAFVGNHRKPEGPVDGEASIITAEAASGGVIATLVNFAAHADILGKRNMQVTADFPGYVCRALEEARGGTALFFNGALGDAYPTQAIQDPDDEKGLRTYEQAESTGRAMAAEVVTALAGAPTGARPGASYVSEAGIRVQKSIIDLPVSNWVLHVMRLMRIFKRKLYRGKVRTESWLVEIDGAQILTVPGQAFCQIGLELKAALPGPHKFLFGLANDELAYIMPPEEWDPKRRSEEELATLGRGTWPALKAGLPLPARRN